MATVPSGHSSGWYRPLLIIAVVIAIPVAAGFLLVRSVTQPKTSQETQDPAELLLRAEDLDLSAADGVPLSGWLIRGRSGWPPVILCHDLGGSRSDLLTVAVVLNKAGFPLVLLDFRRHGKSGASRSTLGMGERLDVLAAVQFLRTRRDVDNERIGGWGVGMGAYALALAALETPQLQALALDSLYPDIPSQVDRLTRAELPPALHPLVPALHLLYNPFFHGRLQDFSIKDRLTALAGRNLLLIAASEQPDRFDEERQLYEALPEGPQGGKNLLTLRRSGTSGLYAEDRTKYDQTLRSFFADYLPGEAARASGRKIEVIER